MSDETKNVIFKVNAKLKHEFKKACLDNKETQTDAMNRLVRYYVNKNGNLKKN